ncbi:dienelactone hydrolase [Nocardioides ginsengisegetis]|uniref:Dienelactone hydrolase n=1 Tax=Nocardioides ginsengisegetis TaxID=661491 RepID=A0A7W3J260_9ACTN|nr:dienelactone hydrolase [Nocardioides ginsengisegetis]
MRFKLTAVTVLATALATGASLAPAVAPAEGADTNQALVRPSKDPFYRYDGSTPLKDLRPGTPLKTRDVTLGADTNGTPVPAEQILYRTTDTRGRAVATVTTVVLPASGTAQPRVAAYLSFYDALSSKCDPSYTLRGGNPGAANAQLTDIEQGAVQDLHQQGYVVTVPDFEGPGLHWVAGRESGRSTLDGITATLRALKLDEKTTPVGMMGYSGGSIAADWASELQPKHAPDLNLVGTAMGGLPVNMAHNLPYVDGTPEWSDVIPGAMLGISRAHGLDLMPYLSDWGRMVVRTESTQCIGEMSGEFPNLTIKHLMKKKYEDILHVPVFKRILDGLVMGSVKGHPSAPMFIVAGNHDGKGDDVMIAADQKALADEYCSQGVTVQYEEIQGADHSNAGLTFLNEATAWLGSRFAGAPAPSSC